MARKLVYSMLTSLDGFVEGPGHDIGWTDPDAELHTFANEEAAASGVFLYGRRMYELMSADWPTADAGPDTPGYIAEFARIWRDKPKVVFSTTLTEVAWNSRLVRENAVEEVAALKEQPGGELEVSGPALAASLTDLIDEYRLLVHPVVLGAGTPYFPPVEKRIPLRLLDTRTFGNGVVFLRYGR
jgi:dihydrofolate reductase